MNAHSIVVGFDYRFGAGGQADVSVLRELASQHSMNVQVVPAVTQYGEKISSSVIREKLLLGEVKLAAELLGTPYEITGKVVAGEGRGRLLGFPTANIEPLYDYVYPRTGVYIIRCTIDGSETPFAGLMNIGYKPTFHERENQLTLEAHLFDFSADLYGKQVQISFLDFLRSEKKFNSVQELIEQIGSDEDEARRRLANEL
jgi:riboflavin kinase/FMN adenylyltransferase